MNGNGSNNGPPVPPAMLNNFTPEQMQQMFAFFQQMSQQGTHLRRLRLSYDTEMSVRLPLAGGSLQPTAATAPAAALPPSIQAMAAASAQSTSSVTVPPGITTTSPDAGPAQSLPDQSRAPRLRHESCVHGGS